MSTCDATHVLASQTWNLTLTLIQFIVLMILKGDPLLLVVNKHLLKVCLSQKSFKVFADFLVKNFSSSFHFQRFFQQSTWSDGRTFNHLSFSTDYLDLPLWRFDWIVIFYVIFFFLMLIEKCWDLVLFLPQDSLTSCLFFIKKWSLRINKGLRLSRLSFPSTTQDRKLWILYFIFCNFPILLFFLLIN